MIIFIIKEKLQCPKSIYDNNIYVRMAFYETFLIL